MNALRRLLAMVGLVMVVSEEPRAPSTPLRIKRSPLVGGRFCRECGGNISKASSDRDGCKCKGFAFID